MNDWPLFCGHAWLRSYLGGPGFWFRVRGYGFLLQAMAPPPLFSERFGYRRVYRFLGCRLEVMRP